MDENMFNKPTIVLSSGNLKNASSSVGMVSIIEVNLHYFSIYAKFCKCISHSTKQSLSLSYHFI